MMTPPSERAPGDISDATLRRLLWMTALVLAATALVVGALGIGRWVRADDSPTPLGAVDIGFLQDMIDHHEQALLIARTYLANNPDGQARPYATEVIRFQERDIVRMQNWLGEQGLGRGQPDRKAMAWMGMASAVSEMPGMQTPRRIEGLAAAGGADAARAFFSILSEHHLGGAGMADYAGEKADRREIRDFAKAMARNQRVEVVEYEQAIDRLGLR